MSETATEKDGARTSNGIHQQEKRKGYCVDRYTKKQRQKYFFDDFLLFILPPANSGHDLYDSETR